jgi:hypothetical protein
VPDVTGRPATASHEMYASEDIRSATRPCAALSLEPIENPFGPKVLPMSSAE